MGWLALTKAKDEILIKGTAGFWKKRNSSCIHGILPTQSNLFRAGFADQGEIIQ